MNKKWLNPLIWGIGIGIVALIIFVGMRSSIEQKLIEEEMTDVEDEPFDAEEYYEQNSELLRTINVLESTTVQTEKEILNDIGNRGFEGNPIFTEYSMDGEYFGELEISETDEKHPSYYTSYISENGEIWTIIVMNGCIMANPVSFNIQSELNVQLIISETEAIMCYSSSANCFYETIPNESELIVKIVDKIDAETLNNLSVEVIKQL